MLDKNKCFCCHSSRIKFVIKRRDICIYKCLNCCVEFAISDVVDIRSDNSKNTIHTDPFFYEHVLANYHSQKEKIHSLINKRLKKYEKFLGKKPENILEIGCGTGAYCEEFKKNDVKYLGIELEDHMAEFAINNMNDVICINFMDMNEETKWDIIFCSQVIEHIDNPKEFFSKISRILSKNGLLHIDVPNHDSAISRVRKIFGKTDYGFIQPYFHMISYNKKSMANLLKQSEFCIDLISAYSNNNKTWGQPTVNERFVNKLVYMFTSIFEMGSLLTVVARKSA